MRVETRELGIVFERRFKRDYNMPCNPPDLGAVKWLLELVQWFECRHQKEALNGLLFLLSDGRCLVDERKNILFKNFQIIIIWYICSIKHSK